MNQAGRQPLRERNKQRNFQRIIDAAFELFQTVGYHQTTMDAIAEKAEVSRATLFNYFPAKQALLVPLANRLYLECVQPEVRAYLETQPTTLQALHRLFLSIHQHILIVPDLYRALQGEFFHREPESTKDAGTGFLEMLLAILQDGKARGEVRTDIPLEKLAHYIGAIYVSLLFHPLEQQTEQMLLANYHAEIETLLAFLSTALSPGVMTGYERKDEPER
jgi:AcrR family transcriptional regulator